MSLVAEYSSDSEDVNDQEQDDALKKRKDQRPDDSKEKSESSALKKDKIKKRKAKHLPTSRSTKQRQQRSELPSLADVLNSSEIAPSFLQSGVSESKEISSFDHTKEENATVKLLSERKPIPSPYGIVGVATEKDLAAKAQAQARAIKHRLDAKKKNAKGKVFWDTEGGFWTLFDV